MTSEQDQPDADEASEKSRRRMVKSEEESGGDRGAGSVGERPELRGTRDSDGRRTGNREADGE